MKLHLVGRRFWLLGHGWGWCQEHRCYLTLGGDSHYLGLLPKSAAPA